MKVSDIIAIADHILGFIQGSRLAKKYNALRNTIQNGKLGPEISQQINVQVGEIKSAHESSLPEFDSELQRRVYAGFQADDLLGIPAYEKLHEVIASNFGNHTAVVEFIGKQIERISALQQTVQLLRNGLVAVAPPPSLPNDRKRLLIRFDREAHAATFAGLSHWAGEWNFILQQFSRVVGESTDENRIVEVASGSLEVVVAALAAVAATIPLALKYYREAQLARLKQEETKHTIGYDPRPGHAALLTS